MKRFFVVILGILLILSSCDSKLALKVINNDKIEVEFALDLNSEFFKILQEFLNSNSDGQVKTDGDSFISVQDVESFLISSGVKVLESKKQNQKIFVKGEISDLKNHKLVQTGIIQNNAKEFKLCLGPVQISNFYELLSEDEKSYIDLLMIPCLIEENQSVAEYQDSLATLYGPELAKQLINGKLSIKLQTGKSNQKDFSVSLGELFTSTEQKVWIMNF